MPYLSINPDSETHSRKRLAADIQGKLSVCDLTPQELADGFNLIEQIGCEIPPAGAPTLIPADYHEWGEEEES
jgi:hypothetical protein